MPYQSRHASSLADLMMRQGEIEASKAQNRGNLWAGVVRGVAGIPAGIQQRKAANAEAQELAFDRGLKRRDMESQIGEREASIAKRIQETLTEEEARQHAKQTKAAIGILGEYAGLTPDEQRAAWPTVQQRLATDAGWEPDRIPKEPRPTGWVKGQMLPLGLTDKALGLIFPDEKAPEPFTLGPGQQRFGAGGGAPIASVDPTPQAPSNPTEASLAAAAAAGDPNALKALALIRGQQRQPQGPQGPRSPIWVIQDGKFVDLAGVAPPGSQPANSREQGRAVTSGDAGRVAEFDTSLDDLAILDQQLGTTGASSKVGAMLPNAVTEWTGWGSDAKQRQGTIDRVKQVIGKALEGGVLRKEDEYKYAKILPTIGDPPEVAKSKLAELRKALTQRRQTFVESLGDAGFDTGKFSARPPRASEGAAPPVADPLGIR